MSQSKTKPHPSDEEIVELYFARDEQAIAETDRKYGKVCMQVSMNISGKVQLHDLLVRGMGLGFRFRLTHMVGSFLGYTPYDTVVYRNLSAKT